MNRQTKGQPPPLISSGVHPAAHLAHLKEVNAAGGSILQGTSAGSHAQPTRLVICCALFLLGRGYDYKSLCSVCSFAELSLKLSSIYVLRLQSTQ